MKCTLPALLAQLLRENEATDEETEETNRGSQQTYQTDKTFLRSLLTPTEAAVENSSDGAPGGVQFPPLSSDVHWK